MYPDETMMKAHGQFVRRAGLVLTPEPCVRDQLPDLLANFELVHADVLVRSTNGSRPLPDIAEHPTVELVKEILGHDIDSLASLKGPSLGPLETQVDVGLLQLIEFSTGAHVELTQAFGLVRIERSRPAGS